MFHTIEKEAYSPNGSRTGHKEQQIEYRMNQCLDEQPQTPTWTSIRFKSQEIPEFQLLKAEYIPGEIKTHLIKNPSSKFLKPQIFMLNIKELIKSHQTKKPYLAIRNP